MLLPEYLTSEAMLVVHIVPDLQYEFDFICVYVRCVEVHVLLISLCSS